MNATMLLVLLSVAIAPIHSFASEDEVPIPGTTLKVKLPVGWTLGAPLPEFERLGVLLHEGNPRYKVQIGETRNEELVADEKFPTASSCGSLTAIHLFRYASSL